jgi:hypothetical protein
MRLVSFVVLFLVAESSFAAVQIAQQINVKQASMLPALVQSSTSTSIDFSPAAVWILATIVFVMDLVRVAMKIVTEYLKRTSQPKSEQGTVPVNLSFRSDDGKPPIVVEPNAITQVNTVKFGK